MTLGEKWQQTLDEISEKELIFEFLENAVKEAIEEKRKCVWISYGASCNGVTIDDSNEDILNEFAKKNGLKVERTHYNGWSITPSGK